MMLENARNNDAALPLSSIERGQSILFENVDLAKYTYMQTGGVARNIIHPRSIEALVSLVTECNNSGLAFRVIGNTSNLLFQDGIDYSLLICTTWLDDISIRDGELVAECGASLPALSRQALYRSQKGFEGLEGIPGTVGAGVFMNAGAYGSEIKDTLVSFDFLHTDGKVEKLPAARLALGHRSSAVRDGALKGVILRCYFKGSPGKASAIYKKMDVFHEKRHRYQDFLYPNLGSLFSGSIYTVVARQDRSVRLMMRYDIWRRRFMKYFLKGTPTDRTFLNDYMVKRCKLNFAIQPFSDKTMNCLVNRGQGTAAMVEYIRSVEALTKGRIPLENEIVDGF